MVGAHAADDREGMTRVVGIEFGDAHQVCAQVTRHLLDVARGDFRRVQVRLGWEDVPLGRIPDHIEQRVRPVCRRSVDEEAPVGIVALPRGPSPRRLEPAGSQRH